MTSRSAPTFRVIGGCGFIAIVILGRWTGLAGALMFAILEALKLNLSQYSDVPTSSLARCRGSS